MSDSGLSGRVELHHSPQSDKKAALFSAAARLGTVLDETNAYVICQHYHEGRSLRSIANDLHIHPESVRKRKVRSIEKLQKCNALKSIYDAFYSEEGLFN